MQTEWLIPMQTSSMFSTLQPHSVSPGRRWTDTQQAYKASVLAFYLFG